MEKKCLICGEIVQHKEERYLKSAFTNHLKKHNISLEDYFVKYELNGEHPKCLCGCGEDVHLKFKSWEWNKYAKDSHVCRAFTEEAKKIKEEMIKSKKVVWDAKEYYNRKYDMNLARESCKDFKSRLYNLSDISEKYGLDKRTLQKMWISLNLITGEEYAKLTSYYKFNMSADKRKEKFVATDNLYSFIYLLIKEHPNKYTPAAALKVYNQNDEFKVDINPCLLYRQMKRLYGDEIDLYFTKGYHSKEEYEFYCVLTFFFPKEKIELGKKISKGKKYYIYDIAINNDFLIEYNSKGNYHNTKEVLEKDEEKKNFAIENGFKYKVLTYDEIKNINILNEIKEWLNL